MIRVTDKQYWMDNYLKRNLDSLVHNAKKDWDFVILISGTGKTRVGKSVLAQQIAYYCSQKLGKNFDIENVVFSGKDLMGKASKTQNSVFVYDEGRAEMESRKAMQKVNQDLFDFFSECGMLNHIIIIVLPDFFELKKGIAIGRSICLLNVFYTREMRKSEGEDVVEFKRGKYSFYNENTKRLLYIKGKKNYDDYSVVKANFFGDFPNVWTVDPVEYDKRKREYISRAREQERPDLRKGQRDFFIHYLVNKMKVKASVLGREMKVHDSPISAYQIGAIAREMRYLGQGETYSTTNSEVKKFVMPDGQ